MNYKVVDGKLIIIVDSKLEAFRIGRNNVNTSNLAYNEKSDEMCAEVNIEGFYKSLLGDEQKLAKLPVDIKPVRRSQFDITRQRVLDALSKKDMSKTELTRAVKKSSGVINTVLETLKYQGIIKMHRVRVNGTKRHKTIIGIPIK